MVFISYAHEDAHVAREIRAALEDHGVAVWMDSRELTAGDALRPEIEAAIAKASHLLVLISPPTMNSKWVTAELKYARRVRKQRSDGFKIIPILLPGAKPSALPHWFKSEPVAEILKARPDAVPEALTGILPAIGVGMKSDPPPTEEPEDRPFADLILKLTDPGIDQSEGKRRATATVQVVYDPPTAGERKIESNRYRFTSPIGPIEAGDLSWYLERYHMWPTDQFRKRAARVEAALPHWGQSLFNEALGADHAREAYEAWRTAGREHARRITIEVDRDPPAGADQERQALADQGATVLLALPWELLRDSRGYLFAGAKGVRVRRRLPNRVAQEVAATKPPIRVLLVSPRPEDDSAGYIDHRVSARPLSEALQQLGDLARLTILHPPTFKALREELDRAHKAGQAYHVVHFDGHGVYDRRIGLGALCFEDPRDLEKLDKRRSELVHAEKLGEIIRDHQTPLFFLEACQSARTTDDPMASVAARLLREGVGSVVAMSHSVLVESARRFTAVFYRTLVGGERVGQAMLAGQKELHDDDFRLKTFAGDLRLQDWFVPVLFQEEHDPPLITLLPSAESAALQKKARKLSLGELPPPPPHSFVGRSRELLAAERLLARAPYAVLRGEGGEGKTALACELARWLVQTQRSARTAFFSVERLRDVRGVADALGRQLVAGWKSVATEGDLEQAVQRIERALVERSAVIVLDNLESILPPPEEAAAAGVYEPELLKAVFDLCQRLAEVDGTRLLFTSREKLPQPFDGNHIGISRLSQEDAIDLVGRVLKESGGAPQADDAGTAEEDVAALVEAVNHHARALVLLAGEVGRAGVGHATRNLHALMARLHEKFPDDRERSLYASLELSLSRLPPKTRARLPRLGVFHGGGYLWCIGVVLGLDIEKRQELELAKQLVNVGLAEVFEGGYLRLDPALCPYLLSQLDEQQREQARSAWAAAVAGFIGFLYRQQFKDKPAVAAKLTLLDLPNLVAALEHLAESSTAEQVILPSTHLEALLQYLDRPRALARVVAVRERTTAPAGPWTHARFEAERAAVERLRDDGNFAQAVQAAEALLRKALAAGESAYEGALYDIALANAVSGHSLQQSGAAEAALPVLAEARRRFEALATHGNTDAERMASVAITRTADCYADLGRLDEAATAYETAIQLDEKRGDARNVAVNKGQLGTVRMLQRRFAEALEAHHEARVTFEKLEEPRSVATAWHQVGVVHQEAGQFDAAEQAYLQAMAINVQLNDDDGRAAALNQLGNLHGLQDRHEEAAGFFAKAADVYAALNNDANEGFARSNLANSLAQLRRYDPARREVLRAIECKQPFGHRARPWTTWAILHKLETAAGDQDAAAAAREKAIEAYLAYRRAGGENLSSYAAIFAEVAQAIADGKTAEADASLAELLAEPDLPAYAKARLTVLRAVLAGQRDPTLADDPALDYDDAAELRLLLERLGAE